MKWKVENALSRDVERQQLNKILAEIDTRIKQLPTGGTSNSGSTNTINTITRYAVARFTFTLEGDVTGSGVVDGLNDVTIQTTLAGDVGIEEAPIDNQYYSRWNGEWKATPGAASPADGFGFVVQTDGGDFDIVNVVREIEIEAGELTVTDGDGIAGNPLLGLADLADSGTGTGGVKLITRDSKGRVSGTENADTGDLPEGSNLYFTDERAQDAVGNILTDTATINFTYNDGLGTITADLIPSYQPLDAQLTSLAALSYTGNSLKMIRVNAGETDFELVTIAATGDVVGPASATADAVVLFDGVTGKLIKDSTKAYTPTGIGLGSVTNDAQTKAAIVPNTAPSAGQILVGNAGGTAYAPVSASGDVTVASTGAMTLATAQPAAHTWALAQTFTLAPVFTDHAGSRDALKIGPRWCFEVIADFAGDSLATTVLGPEWSRSVSGTNALVSPTTGSGSSAGQCVLQLGTTTTGRSAVMNSTFAFVLGVGAVQFNLKGQLSSLSDATDTYIQRLGLMNSETAEPGNGCYFRYSHSLNSGKWQCVTRKASAETATDSGVTAVAGTERHFQILVNAGGTSVDFYIDGALVQTHNTNMPTATLAAMFAAIRSAGTAVKNALAVDVIHARIDFTTPRW